MAIFSELFFEYPHFLFAEIEPDLLPKDADKSAARYKYARNDLDEIRRGCRVYIRPRERGHGQQKVRPIKEVNECRDPYKQSFHLSLQ
jgi:hypothetical protein